jgi:pimeloyl-ACP methyl ester carboxylesterase
MPYPTSERLRQTIRSVKSADGVRLAWAETRPASSGGAAPRPTLLKASNWMTHLELEWESPVWRHWIHFLTENFRYIRYDERGCGMSDWEAEDLGHDRWLEDLEAVAEVGVPDGPFVLLGMSQGAAPAIQFAIRHPERVSALVLYGGYSRGWAKRGDEASHRRYSAMIDLIEHGWGHDNPVFRQLFTSRFIPGGTDEQLSWYNDLAKKTTSPRNAARILQTRGLVDVRALLPEVRVPTLVLHARHDAVVLIEEGRLLASEIPGAQFVELDSSNHVLLENEPAWARFREAVLDFTGAGASAPNASAEESDAFAALSTREREILALVTEGLPNAAIAERLGIREKTVRNHVSNLFDKLGVWSRAQAIVFARDRGFRASGAERTPP